MELQLPTATRRDTPRNAGQHIAGSMLTSGMPLVTCAAHQRAVNARTEGCDHSVLKPSSPHGHWQCGRTSPAVIRNTSRQQPARHWLVEDPAMRLTHAPLSHEVAGVRRGQRRCSGQRPRHTHVDCRPAAAAASQAHKSFHCRFASPPRGSTTASSRPGAHGTKPYASTLRACLPPACSCRSRHPS